MAKLDTLQDSFDAADDTGVWTDSPASGGAVENTGGVQRIRVVGNTGGSRTSRRVSLATDWDWTSSYALWKFVAVPTSALATVIVAVKIDASSEFRWRIVGGTIDLQEKVNGGFAGVGTDTGYVAGTHKWGRLAHDGTNILWQYASTAGTPAEADWQTLHSRAAPALTTGAYTAVQVDMSLFIATDAGAGTYDFEIDDFNASELQYAYPDADVSDGSWTPSTGTDHYAVLDEEPASDTDYVESSAGPVSDTFEVSLQTLNDPQSSSGHVLRVRYGKDIEDASTVNLTIGLYQGATLIASTTVECETAIAEAALTLTGVQADAITDYSDLRVRCTANVV